MHILSSIVLILGALIILVLGLVSVVHDLLERGPHAVPLEQERAGWPSGLGTPLIRRPARTAARNPVNSIANEGRTSSGWSRERENSR